MNTSGEAADQVVRMSLEVGEAALKISGEGAKQLAVLLYAVLQDQSKSMAKSKGKTRLESLVRTGKPLKVFSVKESDLKKFAKEAKRYGILYCAIRNPKENKDGMVDIMVKEEDAPRINRIVERFKLSAVEEKAKVETEVEAEKTKEEGKEKEEQNPSMAKTEKSHPSEPTSEKQEKEAEGTSKLYTGDSPERKSVREELKEIRAAKKQEADAKKQEVGLEGKKADTRKPSDKRTVQHKQPRQKKPKKKER